MKVILDGLMIHTKDDLHNTFAQAMAFPEWYGRNLDALHDCLTDIHEDSQIIIYNYPQLEEHLGIYTQGLRAVLRRAEESNPFIHVFFC